MKKWEPVDFLIIIIPLVMIVTVVFVAVTSKPKDITVGEDTMRLCREYAYRDHRGEMTPERWEWLEQFGDPNDHEFFYQSCIGHITGKPATKGYMQ